MTCRWSSTAAPTTPSSLADAGTTAVGASSAVLHPAPTPTLHRRRTSNLVSQGCPCAYQRRGLRAAGFGTARASRPSARSEAGRAGLQDENSAPTGEAGQGLIHRRRLRLVRRRNGHHPHGTTAPVFASSRHDVSARATCFYGGLPKALAPRRRPGQALLVLRTRFILLAAVA